MEFPLEMSKHCSVLPKFLNCLPLIFQVILAYGEIAFISTSKSNDR